MAISSVKSDLDSIAQVIAGASSQRDVAKNNLLVARNQLNGLQAQFADTLAEINGYTPTGAFETLAKDELSGLTTEFVTLKTAIEAELTALGVTF